MKDKYIYYATSKETLRCKISFNKKENCTELVLQRYKGWVSGWINIIYPIDIFITNSDRTHPRISSYDNGGHAEYWDKKWFNLQDRCNELFEDRQKALRFVEQQKEHFNSLL